MFGGGEGVRFSAILLCGELVSSSSKEGCNCFPLCFFQIEVLLCNFLDLFVYLVSLCYIILVCYLKSSKTPIFRPILSLFEVNLPIFESC